jgi:hypothetical protein
MNDTTKIIMRRKRYLSCFEKHQKEVVKRQKALRLKRAAQTHWTGNTGCWERFVTLKDSINHVLNETSLSKQDVKKMLKKKC